MSTIEYIPANGQRMDTYTRKVRSVLDAAEETYGAYPFSNAELAEESGVAISKLLPVLAYLAKRGEWIPHRARIALSSDPALSGRELRRGSVLVRGNGVA